MNGLVYELSGVSKQYDGRCVLRVSELQVRQGEILALVGPSGAGKSTLLRLLNFLEPPSQGEIRFLGQSFDGELSAPLELRRRVTTVFQRPILLNRSVQANVAYGLRLRGQRDTAHLVAEALEQVGLTDLARARAWTLSGGEAQRVALARSIVLKPQVLLLDEPTANLDPYNVGLIEDIVSRLNAERGVTVVLVTHNIFQARRLADRVGLLLGGEIIELAETEAFFERPRDRRTKAFVEGEMVY